ncbi:tyrosine-type recombinase/integrase [Paenisporosarcina cavernae]|uniref:Site-specific integrase n=1 Tax=Paenisporosarcina cavernae TaxID=2320858 RepID=A0A385YSN2_9BACL|nr:site-specific integrase [Paenisporosarcina cavernae]AYC28688.1 site-specific integrase [Paenisporosarcina cavernae]
MASYKEVSPGKYKLYVELGYDAKGKRIRKTKTVEAGAREVKKLLSAFEQEVYNSQHLEVEKMSFLAFAEIWKTSFAKRNWASTTYEKNMFILNQISPYLESMYIQNIKTLHLVQYFKDESDRGGKSLVKKYEVLKSVFKKAVEWNVLKTNPMDGIEKPKPKVKKREFYNKKEIQNHLRILDQLNTYQKLIIKAALIGALRREEILGIATDVVDYANNQILIKRALVYTKEHGLELKKTKNGEERTVTFPEDFMQELKEFYIKKLNERMAMGNLWNGFKGPEGDDLFMIFSNEYGVPFRPDSVTQFWGRIVKKYGLKKISFHDLRHSSASLLLSEGVNMKVIQNRLGHKNIKTTMNIYAHATLEDDEKASNVFKNLL